MDLGEYWEESRACPIPLGGIVVKRVLSDAIQQKVNRVIRRSVEFAFEQPRSGFAFICSHAQEMSEEVIYQHINLYVNQYSIDLGEEGRRAITLFFEEAIARNIISISKQTIFC